MKIVYIYKSNFVSCYITCASEGKMLHLPIKCCEN